MNLRKRLADLASYQRLGNFLWYQGLWFLAVLGGVEFSGLLLPVLAIHLLAVDHWRSEALLMLGVATLGVGVDSLLATAGFYVFDAGSSLLPIPAWLVAIWLAFAGTLRHSMAFMVGRPRLMSFAAGIFAPLTYLAAQRLGAVSFPLGNLPTAIVIGLAWFTLTPALVTLARIAEDSLPLVSFGRNSQKEQSA